VERERWRKPERITLAAFADDQAEYLPGRNLKPSTVADYGYILDSHLRPYFGHLELAAIEPADFDAYTASRAGQLSPKTISKPPRPRARDVQGGPPLAARTAQPR
jgi:Phage integrase, N-terminal SAM-like domain